MLRSNSQGGLIAMLLIAFSSPSNASEANASEANALETNASVSANIQVANNAESVATQPSEETNETSLGTSFDVENFVSPTRIGSSAKLILTMSVLSLAPAILLMTTSYIRISVVLSLLRQAMGATQIPSNQVTTSISLFMTLLIMWPVWSAVYHDAIVPYSNSETDMTWQQSSITKL